MAYLDGTDWSHWQGESSVLTAQGAGLVFFFFKATQGTSLADSRFQNYRAQAEEANVIWAPYHFFQANLDPIAQADFFFSTVGQYQGMPPVVDFELTYNMSKAVINQRFISFVDRVEVLFGVKPIIYTRGYFWNYWMYRDSRWNSYPLWVAHYGAVTPYMPADWEEWGFWQYTDTADGAAYGVSSTGVDLNYCPWSLAELQEFAGFTPDPPPPPPSGAGFFSAYVYASALNVRTGPGTAYPKAQAAIHYGTEVRVFGQEYNVVDKLSWGKINDTEDKWVALKWLTMTL